MAFFTLLYAVNLFYGLFLIFWQLDWFLFDNIFISINPWASVTRLLISIYWIDTLTLFWMETWEDFEKPLDLREI